MIIFNEKNGAGNEAWKKALAKATADKVFQDTRKVVLKMMGINHVKSRAAK